jgi:hypothetical protein
VAVRRWAPPDAARALDRRAAAGSWA